MGFDVLGPSGRVCASNFDDGVAPSYDVFSMPEQFGLRCPQLENLRQRFYQTTVLHNDDGSVGALRDELVELRDAYRAQREPELVLERKIRVQDPTMRQAVLDRLLHDDPLYRVIDDFRRLCDEAVAAAVPLQCIGD